MQATGYVPNGIQTPQSLFGIELACVWLPAIGFLLAAVPVWFYLKYERLELQIQADLLRRRQEIAPAK